MFRFLYCSTVNAVDDFGDGDALRGSTVVSERGEVEFGPQSPSRQSPRGVSCVFIWMLPCQSLSLLRLKRTGLRANNPLIMVCPAK